MRRLAALIPVSMIVCFQACTPTGDASGTSGNAGGSSGTGGGTAGGVNSSTSSTPPPEPSTIELKIMSFNIRWSGFNDPPPQDWATRRPLVESVITTHAPDIIGFQENNEADQSPELDADLADYTLFYFDPGIGGNHPIGYNHDRFQLDDSGTAWISQGYGPGYDKAVTWIRLLEKSSGNGLYIYNVHYAAGGPNGDQNHYESSKALLELITNRALADPFVVTGDFNTTEDNDAITMLLGTLAPAVSLTPGKHPNPVPLIDTYRALYSKMANEGTASGFSGNTDGRRIDFIFVPHDSEVLEAGIIRDDFSGVYPSDHFPVNARVVLHR